MSTEPGAEAAARPGAPAGRESPVAALRRDYLSNPVSRGFFVHLFKAVFKRHHRELIPALRRVIARDAVVFDVGAHAGQFTKLFARLAPDGLVFAVEPGSYARAILRLAVLLNRLANVTILPMALGERPGAARLTMPVKRAGRFGFGLSHLGPSERPGPIKIEAVAVVTLDDLVASLGLDRLDFIKADIEGWELHLVRGGRNSLARFRPTLFLEMSQAHFARAGDSLEAAWAALTELGYLPHEITADGDFAPLDGRREADVLWLAD